MDRATPIILSKLQNNPMYRDLTSPVWVAGGERRQVAGVKRSLVLKNKKIV